MAESSVHTSMCLLQSMAASLLMFTGECPDNPIANIHLSKLEILACYFIYTGKRHKLETPAAMPNKKQQGNKKGVGWLLISTLQKPKCGLLPEGSE